jgi:hypothetical protein
MIRPTRLLSFDGLDRAIKLVLEKYFAKSGRKSPATNAPRS